MRKHRCIYGKKCWCGATVETEMAYSQQPACWPMKSEALAVHPNQRKEATENARKQGVPTDFDKQGRPIFMDRAHRRAYCRAYGFYDRDAGYADAQRHSCTREVPDPIDPAKLIFGG